MTKGSPDAQPAVKARFDESDWHEFALVTSAHDIFEKYPRLLRSLSFGDPDYGSIVSVVLQDVVDRDKHNLEAIVDHFNLVEAISEAAPASLHPYLVGRKELPQGTSDLGSMGRPESVFVVMPFSGVVNSYYEPIFKRAIEGAGLKSIRADEIYSADTIMNDIYSGIKYAKIVLAELTGKNPNVLYELGLSHGLNKPTIMVTQSMDDVPSDLRNRRCIVYRTSGIDWADKLRNHIARTLESVLSNPAAARFEKNA